MKVNMKQISELTGFSQATISNALNKKRGVNADTEPAYCQLPVNWDIWRRRVYRRLSL